MSIVHVPVDVRELSRVMTPCTGLIEAISDDGTNVEFRYNDGVAVDPRSQCRRPVASIWTDETPVPAPVVIVAALSVDDVVSIDVVRIFADLPAIAAIYVAVA
jgi:hypothetical protein